MYSNRRFIGRYVDLFAQIIWMFLKNLLRIWTKKKFFPKLNISNNGMWNFIKPVRIIRKQV